MLPVRFESWKEVILDYYLSLQRFFDKNIELLSTCIFRYGGNLYPIYKGVYIFLKPDELPLATLDTLCCKKIYESYFAFWAGGRNCGISKAVQTSFSEEWTQYDQYLPEFNGEFKLYFDIVDIGVYQGKTVLDLGCGIGRWASYLADSVDCILCVDFSEAIFVTAEKLRQNKNCYFIMADILNHPFKDRSFDFVYSLGVLHHLPVNALGAVEQACRCVKDGGLFLGYLYYALDNRPKYFRVIFKWVDMLRIFLSKKVENKILKTVVVLVITLFVYKPMIWLGHFFNLFGLGAKVPLYEFYKGKSLYRIRQDVVDRFFTTIEQRYSKEEIAQYIEDNRLGNVRFSAQNPFWHFIIKKDFNQLQSG